MVTDLASFIKSPRRARIGSGKLFRLCEKELQHAPALYLFDIMYRHIRGRTIPRKKSRISRKHLATTSALRSSQPWAIAPHHGLYDALQARWEESQAFWKEAYDQALAEDGMIFSLLSSSLKRLFQEIRQHDRLQVSGKPRRQAKVHSTISKKRVVGF